MTRVTPTGFVEPNEEIDRTIHQRLREVLGGLPLRLVEVAKETLITIAEERRTLSIYERPQFTGGEFSVQGPAVGAGNFDLARLIGTIQNTVQFDGLAEGDPNEHLSRFLQMCLTFKVNERF